MIFLNEYGELESVYLEYWEVALRVSASGALWSRGGINIPLSAIFFMLTYKNISVYNFIHDDRKRESGAMAKTAGVAMANMALLRVMGWLVALLVASSFILLVFVLEFPFFVSVNAFAFQRVVYFIHLFLKKKPR